ncbi:hypothetical protein [Oscillatoria acuminata]|uniref:DUF3619 family protein n=1 Tax=Oscillatoria acuminata PCC 6304 TaxID=56110 RepID=K9TLS5_9CYAN|nr:hypothetical protein [Oscillatoria acuminata]AFY82959.1 hypothetical protein Oscil6304_3389 [Oscillatoria acuminata PCC 6304]
MNQPPEKPDHLVDFLRQHRPDIPPASPQLEARILAAVAGDRSKARRYSSRILWLIVPSIAASLSLAFWGIKPGLFSPTPASNSAQLEAFMEYTWNGLLQDEMLDPSNDLIFGEEENISRLEAE